MEFREITERYRLEKILKSSKSGTVLRAIDTASGRPVVVKLIPVGSAPNLEGRMGAFNRLAAAIGALGHPALPVVLDSGLTPDGSAFLVLEHLEGGRGLDTLAGAAPNRALPLLMQVVSGLEALAGQRVPYLNLSPDNVLVIPGPAGDPVGEQAKILGLGTVLFQPVGGPGDEGRRFRAPELLSPLPGERADARADLYSLGVASCHVLGATVAGGAPGSPDPGVQMPLALSFELENAEALRQMLERCLRRRPAERPSHQAVRYAFQLALEGSESPLWQPAVPTPAEVLQPKPAVPAGVLAAAAPEIGAPEMAAVPIGPIRPISPIGPISPAATDLAPAAAAPPPIAAAPAPAVPDPGPAPEGDVLSVVDDDLLEALAPAAAPPPPPPGKAAKPARVLPFGRSKPAPAPAPPGATAEGQAGAAGEAVPAVPPRGRRPLLLGVAAALLLVAALAVLWIMLREPATVSPPPPASASLATAPRRPPQPPAAERLEEARLLVAEGEDDRAREILATFTAADEASLPPSACRLLDGLRETLVLAARDRLPADLTAGLAGNLARLRSAVNTGIEQPELVAALPPEAQADFDRARRAMELYTEAEGAARDGQHAVALERLAALLALSPDLADPQELRKKSAGALETEAETLVEEGRYPEAIAKLEPLRRTWPDRLGLAARVASYEGYQKAEAEQKRILEAIPGVERRRKPHEGLEALAGVKPTPHLAPQFAQARGRLENLLAQLDREPPKVVLREGYGLTYSRGSVVTLSFRATDDYEVKSVKLMLRAPGGKMRSMPMEETRQGHTIEIPPSLHQNGTVELYVTATDRSGHEGSLGSAAQPLKVTREQGFERIVR